MHVDPDTDLLSSCQGSVPYVVWAALVPFTDPDRAVQEVGTFPI